MSNGTKVTPIPSLRRVYKDTKANLDALTGLVEEDLGFATDEDKLYRWSGSAWERIAEIPSVDVGEGHITLFSHNYDSIGAGTWGLTVDATQFLCGWLANSTSDDGDNYSLKAYLQAGTYTLRALAITGLGMGITDIDIEGVEVASFDWYSGSTVKNIVKSQTGIVIASSGLKTIRVRVDGKNGSANNYSVAISVIALWRTA